MLVSKLTLCSGVDAQRRFGGASLLASTPGRSPDRLRQTAHDGDRAHEARLRGACSRWDPMAVILLALAIAGFVGRSRGTLNTRLYRVHGRLTANALSVRGRDRAAQSGGATPGNLHSIAARARHISSAGAARLPAIERAIARRS